MNRRKNIRTRGARKRPQRVTTDVVVPRTIRTRVKPWHVAVLRTTILSTINFAANLGANSTFSPFQISTFGTSSTIAGLSRELVTASNQNGRYLNARVKKLRVFGKAVNKDAFPVRCAALMSPNSPANNTLGSQATQLPFLDSATCAQSEVLSEVGGQNRWDFEIFSTLKEMFGVKNVRGLADPFTNSWDSTLDAQVAALEGMNFLFFILSAVNLVNGCFVDLTFEMTVEFFGLNGDIIS